MMTLCFARSSQALYIAIYSWEYEKAFPTKLFLVSKLLKLLLTGKVKASLLPSKQKKRKKKGWEGLSSVIILMTVLLHFKLQFVPYFIKLSHNSVVCLPLDSSLPSSAEIVPSPSRLVYGNSLLSFGTSDKQCKIALVKLEGFLLGH